MPTWEEQKRAGQTAFILTGNLFQDMHSSIGNAYQQILVTGHLYPSTGKDSLTHQITEDMFKQPEHEDIGRFGRQHTFEQSHDPDQDIEPER
ncbi:MAG TPA: hypothetical protein VFV38_09935 [Ktedonobacteraceae bacterium]|nr:hypothetical protein [Ktedonobacteraceae bacterium]